MTPKSIYVYQSAVIYTPSLLPVVGGHLSRMADLCLDCVLALRASVNAAFMQVDQVSKEMGVSLTFWLVAGDRSVFLLQL